MARLHFAIITCSLLFLNFSGISSKPSSSEESAELLEKLFKDPNSLPKQFFPFIDHEDSKLRVPDLIAKYGYPIERHSITTGDGYILEAHRIPYGKKCGPAEGKKVVWLQHGLLGDSSNWVINGPEKGLAYVMADACYDVWMGNFRGNTYSKRHVTLDPSKDKKEFWEHSWNEIGLNDVSANIDYALATTGQPSLYYVGHSMGTTTMWILLSEKPEYNAKIRLMNALAPVAYTEHMISPLSKLAPFEGAIEWIINMLGMYEFLPSSAFMDFLGRTFCREVSPVQFICSNVLFLIVGYNFDQIDPLLLSVVMGHSPAGSSSGNLLHYSQGVNSGEFRKWNYGKAGNIEKYGSELPPNYPVENITAPVAFYWGQNDWLGTPADVYHLAERIPSLVRFYRVNHDYFNHMDFIWGKDANPLINEPLMKFMSKF